MAYSDNMVITLNNIASDYAGQMEAAIKTILSQARYTNTGQGAGCVSVSVQKGNTNESPALVVKLDDHVLKLDKSKMQWTKLPNMGKLIAWAKTKKSEELQAKKLAYAVAWDKKNNDTWKPKKWRKKGLGPTLKEMNAAMLVAFNEAIEKDFQEGINKALNI